jgi:hypothetical protein
MNKEQALAVLPSTISSFDPHMALWATDNDHARALARTLGVPCHLWVCPPVGREFALCRI